MGTVEHYLRHSYVLLDFSIYSLWSLFINVQLGWGGDLSSYKHNIKHKTNMGQPHYKQRPRESKTISQPSTQLPPHQQS